MMNIKPLKKVYTNTKIANKLRLTTVYQIISESVKAAIYVITENLAAYEFIEAVSIGNRAYLNQKLRLTTLMCLSLEKDRVIIYADAPVTYDDYDKVVQGKILRKQQYIL